MNLPTGFTVKVQSDQFFKNLEVLYGEECNVFKRGDVLYVTQEVFDRLKAAKL